MRILVIEDEIQLARHIGRALERAGHTFGLQHDGPAGLAAALAQTPDLVVLDLNLPHLDGFAVLTRLRAARCPARVLILTARGETDERVRGLKSGADDYLTKPFALEELVARVEALGRRGGTQTPSRLLTLRDLQLDVEQRRVTRAGQPIPLSPREFDLLKVLLQEPGRVFSRTELCERIWRRDHAYDTRTVEIFITRLRKKVDAAFAVPLIRTVRLAGYTLRAGG